MRVLVMGGVARSLVNFRGPLLKALRDRGHEVVAAANGHDDAVEAALERLGVAYQPIRITRAGMNPLTDARTLVELLRLMRYEKPDVVLSYTIKPVIYGGLAARMCRVGTIYSLVTGLGYAFLAPRSVGQRAAGLAARCLYRLSLRHSRRVFFQNPDDLLAFRHMRLITDRQGAVVNGSGVDLDHFRPDETGAGIEPGTTAIRFLLIGRLLWDKGIGEYAEAARILGQRGAHAEFHLVGDVDLNPAGLRPADVDAWVAEGLLRYHGAQDDVRPFIRDCHVYVLPSYREGTPRTVLEAMAMGRPIVTTDVPGCRETVPLTARGREQRSRGEAVMEGENGLLVRARDAEALASALATLVHDGRRLHDWGVHSRALAIEKYDVHRVNATMLEAMHL